MTLLVVLPAMPTADEYPGDAAYTALIQALRQQVHSDAMDFPWAGRQGVSREALCRGFVDRHHTAKNPEMTQPNTAWVGYDERTPLEDACLSALTETTGYPGPEGWAAWQGTHQGTWYASDAQFQDTAQWGMPERIPSKVDGDFGQEGDLRTYTLQRVHWPGRTVGRDGWNQSHPEVPYVWGWDPKENGNENGRIGAHLGFSFTAGPLHGLLWITPKTAYFEVVNTQTLVTRMVNGRAVRGFAKASTELAGPHGGGLGQWMIVR